MCFLKHFITLTLLAWLMPQLAVAAEKPNIVFIVVDDLGHTDCGFMGGRQIKTPHIDRLAHGGAILNAHYVQTVCSPTRAALMTGRYAKRTGVYTIVRPHAPWGLPLSERTLAQSLRDAGYETAIVGKWHLGEYQEAYRPTRRGFDHQYGHWYGMIDYFTKMRDKDRDWYRNDQPNADEGYSTHLLAKEACRLVREKREKPLFLYLPFNAVHSPYQVPKEYSQPYEAMKGNRREYAGMLAAVDEAVGQLVAALTETKQLEKTLIVFTSDNGGPSPGQVTDNSPLRAGKGTLYEGGIRVAAFANYPGKIPAGQKLETPLHAVDWFPTLTNLAGGSIPAELEIDGIDIWPTLTAGKQPPREALLFCGNRPEHTAIRVGDWKLISTEGADDTEETAGGKKKKKAATKNAVELYDLKNDLSEQHDLAATKPEIVKDLQAKLAAMMKDAAPSGAVMGK